MDRENRGIAVRWQMPKRTAPQPLCPALPSALRSPCTVKKERIPSRFFGLACLILSLCIARVSFAAPPDGRISQYGHTVWRLQDGFFGGMVRDITQTADGYIWAGTDAGLFKFD